MIYHSSKGQVLSLTITTLDYHQALPKIFIGEDELNDYTSQCGNSNTNGTKAALEACSAALGAANKANIPDRDRTQPSKKAESSERSSQQKLRAQLKNLTKDNELVLIKNNSDQP